MMDGSAIFSNPASEPQPVNAVLQHQRRQHELNLAIQFHAQVCARTANPAHDEPFMLSEAEQWAFDAACRLLGRTFKEGI